MTLLVLCASRSLAAAPDAINTEVPEIIVTGTRVPSAGLTGIAPVTMVDAADIRAQGVTRIEDMTNALPQVFAGQGSSISNNATGTATVDLRGLGPTRTLVLIDGRRAQGAPADLNFIPAPLVERIDVLSGGASATYGADAVAGVVNFIMLKNFQGVRIEAQYSGYQHDNHDSDIQAVVRAAAASATLPSQYRLPPSSVYGGEGFAASLILGLNAANGRGNITAYASYRMNNAILEADRDFSACALNAGATFASAGCGGSGTSYPARVGAFVVDPTTFNTFRARTGADVFNFAPQNFFLRPDERYALGAFAHYEIAPSAQAYVEVMFMDDNSTAQIASGGIFAGLFSINCANPLLSTQERSLLTASRASGGGACDANTNGTFTGVVARRLLPEEQGGRTTQFRHEDSRIVLGLRGELGKTWRYDGYLQYGAIHVNDRASGNFLPSRINQSLNAVANADGQIVCNPAANPETGCVPINIFTSRLVSAAAIKFLSADSFFRADAAERIASLALTGRLGDYGVRSPLTTDGVGVALGAEYRREHLDTAVDALQTDVLPFNGGFDVYELFGEARVPLISNRRYVSYLGLEVGYRFSEYSSVGVTDTYKAAADWQVTPGLRFRGGYNRAVRAPSIGELFAAQVITDDASSDPCAGLAAANPLVATCAKIFHLTPAQVLGIEKNSSNQYNGLTGGNPNLRPEFSDTYTGGIGWQPSFAPGFKISADYFDIRVRQFIGRLGANLILNQCVATANPFFCDLVHRDANGSLWLSDQSYVQDTMLNTGSLRTTGVDVNVTYRTDLSALGLGDNGAVSWNLVATWLGSVITQPLPGGPLFDCRGLYGVSCGTPRPEWRHKLRVVWSTPYAYGDWTDHLSLSAQWRYFSKVTLDAYDHNPQLNNPGLQFASERTLAAQSYIDLSASFTVRNNLSFRIGVNNVFDKDPPLAESTVAPSPFGNGNTFPQVYDALGRFLFVGLTADF